MKKGEQKLPIYRAQKPHTADEIAADAKKRVSLINKEFSEGFELIRKYPKSVTVFGSSVLPETDPYYAKTRELAAKISKLGYTVVTGGGAGIMEAANRGAFEAGGKSIGLNIKLPHEQNPNPYLTDYHQFHYFFSRKVALTFAAEAYLFFPGGYGTLNELSEIIMLIQTQRIKPVPVILFGDGFWEQFDQFIKENLLKRHMIDAEDLTIYKICGSDEEVIDILRSLPVVSSVPFKND